MSRKIVEFVTVSDWSLSDFDREVNSYLKNGWEIRGRVQYVVVNTNIRYHLEMVRYEDVDKVA
jgi:hypothetical protein